MNEQEPSEASRAAGRGGGGCLIWAGAGVVLLLGLMLTGYLFESWAEETDAASYPPPGRLVDIGGYRLHLHCMGNGSPPVVIDGGWGDWSSAWGGVQAELAQTTRVCTYDRAGMGWSDAGPLPRDAAQFAAELHTLLEKADVVGPYVLVGHSLGGLPVRVFTGKYTPAVAGVVLIDSMTPEQFPPGPKRPAGLRSPLMDLPVWLARLGIVRLVARPLGLAGPATADNGASFARLVRSQTVQAYFDEGQGLPAGGAEAGAVKSFGEIPLIVVTAKLNKLPNWQERQAGLLHLSAHSQQVFAESDHNIQLNAPDAAVAAIRAMVDQVRLTAEQSAARTAAAAWRGRAARAQAARAASNSGP